MTLVQQDPQHHHAASNRSGDETPARHTALDIRVITHNIRYATKSPFKGEELWSIRRPRLCAGLKFNTALPETFVCLQEVLHEQLIDVLESLNSMSQPQEEWKAVGVGRDDGKEAGEYSPVLYRPAVWELLSSSHRWLRPDFNTPGKGWDASSIRIVTFARFRHIKTGHDILLINTHLDNAGVVARAESVKLILEWIGQVQEHRISVLMTGDFNSPPSDEAYSLVTAPESFMEDVALQVAKEDRYGNDITYTSFGYVDNNPARIDFIFARKLDGLRYKSFAVLSNRFDDRIYVSDHRPCVADIQISRHG